MKPAYDSEQASAIKALPLEGKRVVVTRAREQAGDLVARLRTLGATPIECPAISIASLADSARLDQALNRLDAYDWVIFTSANGVRMVVDRMAALGMGATLLRSRKIGAIGPATRAALEDLGCEVSFVPDTYVAEAIVEQIGDVAGQRVLLPRADIAREALAVGLMEKGALVDEVAAYRTVHGAGPGVLADLLRAGRVDAITFTSSSTVRYTIEGLCDAGLSREEAVALLGGAAIACIGPITAGTASECGLGVAAVAEEYTSDGLVDALVKLFDAGPRGTGKELRDA